MDQLLFPPLAPPSAELAAGATGAPATGSGGVGRGSSGPRLVSSGGLVTATGGAGTITFPGWTTTGGDGATGGVTTGGVTGGGLGSTGVTGTVGVTGAGVECVGVTGDGIGVDGAVGFVGVVGGVGVVGVGVGATGAGLRRVGVDGAVVTGLDRACLGAGAGTKRSILAGRRVPNGATGRDRRACGSPPSTAPSPGSGAAWTIDGAPGFGRPSSGPTLGVRPVIKANAAAPTTAPVRRIAATTRSMPLMFPARSAENITRTRYRRGGSAQQVSRS